MSAHRELLASLPRNAKEAVADAMRLLIEESRTKLESSDGGPELHRLQGSITAYRQIQGLVTPKPIEENSGERRIY